jgi:hypothetical protein
MNRHPALALMALAPLAASCGKQVEFIGKVKNVVAPKGPACSDLSDRLTWHWDQPARATEKPWTCFS